MWRGGALLYYERFRIDKGRLDRISNPNLIGNQKSGNILLHDLIILYLTISMIQIIHWIKYPHQKEYNGMILYNILLRLVQEDSRSIPRINWSGINWKRNYKKERLRSIRLHLFTPISEKRYHAGLNFNCMKTI